MTPAQKTEKATYWLEIWAGHPSTKAKNEEIGHVEAMQLYPSGAINCWDDMDDSVDAFITRAMDEIIFVDLPSDLSTAIQVRYGMLPHVFNFRAGYEEAVKKAYLEIYRLGIKKNLV